MKSHMTEAAKHQDGQRMSVQMAMANVLAAFTHLVEAMNDGDEAAWHIAHDRGDLETVRLLKAKRAKKVA